MTTSIEPLQVAVVTEDATTTLVVAGELDVFSVPQLREGFRTAWTTGAPKVVADLGGVSFLDASGITALIAVCREADERGRELILRPSETIRRIARLAGVDGSLIPLGPEG